VLVVRFEGRTEGGEKGCGGDGRCPFKYHGGGPGSVFMWRREKEGGGAGAVTGGSVPC
jgi:hypothetical protein